MQNRTTTTTNSHEHYAHKYRLSSMFKGISTENKRVLLCQGYDFEEDPENINENPFFARKMKLYSRLDGFVLYGKLGIDFFTASEIKYSNMKLRIRLIRAGTIFYIINENPNVDLGVMDCSLSARRVMLKENYHKKRLAQLAFSSVEYKFMETSAKIKIIPAQQNQLIQEKNFSNTPIRQKKPLQ